MSRKDAFRRHGTCVQTGATLVEFIISLPMFLMLIFIIAELSLMYQAKLMVNLASLAAARAGAVSGGDKSRMKQAAVLALAPLYANAKNSELKDALQGAGKDMGLNVLIDGAPSVVEDDNGKKKMVVRGTTGFMSIDGGGEGGESAGRDKTLLNFHTDISQLITPLMVLDIDIRSPNGDMVSGFGVKRKIKGKDEEEIVIPNDNLMYRKRDVRGGVNIQDANLLKIKLTYLYELKMPLTRYFFTPFMDANLTRRVFSNNSDGKKVEEELQKVLEPYLKELEYRIPLVSYSTVRMQSDFRKSSLPK
jgi:hypothetical protein